MASNSARSAQTSIRGAATLQALLAGLAHALLPRGMTPKRFSELARCAFVQAAADMSRLRNGRVNHSRVAAQTGLTRADVKRSLRYDVFALPGLGQTPIERVIDAWSSDRRFCIRGRPKPLRISGGDTSFARLVSKYGGDVPHRAVLDELRRVGAIKTTSGLIGLRTGLFRRRRQDFAFLSPVLPALLDSLRIASARSVRQKLLSMQRISLPVQTEVDLTIARSRCASSAKSMLEGLQHSLGKQVTLPPKGRTATYSLNITVLLAENQTKRKYRSRLPR